MYRFLWSFFCLLTLLVLCICVLHGDDRPRGASPRQSSPGDKLGLSHIRRRRCAWRSLVPRRLPAPTSSRVVRVGDGGGSEGCLQGHRAWSWSTMWDWWALRGGGGDLWKNIMINTTWDIFEITWEFLRAGGGGPGLVRLSAEPCLVAPFEGGGGGRDWQGTLGGGRGAPRSAIEVTLFLGGSEGGGKPTGPGVVCSGLGGGDGGHCGSPAGLSGLLLVPRNRLAW